MSNGSDQPVYDIFVSYAHVNDEPPPFVARGWVSTFVDTMKGCLAEELGRRDYVHLWMDYELRGNQSVTPAIHAKLTAARILVLFLSKGYLESRWCMDELESFVARTRGLGGLIFPVCLWPVEPVPAPLQDLLKYQFWREDERGRPRRLADPQPDPAREPDYYRLHRDLARDLAQALGAPDTRARAKAAPQPAPTPDGAPRPLGRVFVAGATDDLDLVRRTAVLLRERGLHCLLPVTAIEGFDPGTPSRTIRRDLEATVEQSDAVLFVYRDGPAIQTRQTINDVRKLAARNHRIPARIDLCQPHRDPSALGLDIPDLNVIVAPADCGEDCARACAQRFADGFAARYAGEGGRP